jgi:hypothetical protein
MSPDGITPARVTTDGHDSYPEQSGLNSAKLCAIGPTNKRQHRRHQALDLAQRQLGRRKQHQSGLNGRARIPSLPAWPKGLPAFQRRILDPQGEAARRRRPAS